MDMKTNFGFSNLASSPIDSIQNAPNFFGSVTCRYTVNSSKPQNKTFRVCLDLGKLEGKKKNLESSFLSIVWFEKSQKEKK